MSERLMSPDIIIAGPCAAESREQVLNAAITLKQLGLENELEIILRAPDIKPRTEWKPHNYFEGVGPLAIPWYAEVTKMGMAVATEVMNAHHVDQIINGVDKEGGDSNKMLLWIGSRRQANDNQTDIARAFLNAPPGVRLLFKNAPWPDKKQWLGILSHIERAFYEKGIPFDKSRIIGCHRGFHPFPDMDTDGDRNIPLHRMAMEVRETVGIPMVLDPSHIGGSVERVFHTVKEGLKYRYDGLMVEVHPNPAEAKTDAKQQLSYEQFGQLLQLLK